MATFKNLGYFFSAISTGTVCGGIAFFTLGTFFPPEAPASVSYIACMGGLLGFSTGLYTGWRWAQNIAESIISEILEKIIVGAVSFVMRAF